MKHINPFDRMVQEQLAQEAEPAPMHLWDEIDTRMALQDQLEKDKKRRWLLLFLFLFTTGTSAWLSYENFYSIQQENNITLETTKSNHQDVTTTNLNLEPIAQPAREYAATINSNTNAVSDVLPTLSKTNESSETATEEKNTASIHQDDLSSLVKNREQITSDNETDFTTKQTIENTQKENSYQTTIFRTNATNLLAQDTGNKATIENKTILSQLVTTESIETTEKEVVSKEEEELNTKYLLPLASLDIDAVQSTTSTTNQTIFVVEQEENLETTAKKTKTKVQHKKRNQKQASDYSALKRFFTIAPDPGSCYSFGGRNFDLRGIYIDAIVSSDLPFRTLESKDNEMLAYQQMRDNSESYYWAGTGGLRLSVVTNSGLAFRTGLTYAQITERFKYENLLAERIIIENIYDSNNNIIGTDTLIEQGKRVIEHSNHYNMFDIPLVIGYELESEKLVFNVNVGAYFNLLFTQNGRILSSNFEPIDINNKTMFRKNLGISYFASMGFNYKFTRDLHLVIEPQLRYYPKSFTRDSYEISQKYVNFGVFTGLRFRL